jgi:uncharacterized membrane protein
MSHAYDWVPTVIRARPRLVSVFTLALLTGIFLPRDWVQGTLTRWLVAWNVGACLYVCIAAMMMSRSTPQHMRRRAQLQDDGQVVILALVTIAGIASLAAIAGELGVVKVLDGAERRGHVALALLTVLSSWAFIQVMFTLHYAHDYYAAVCRKQRPGLQFPGEEHPEYGDFFYFAAVIGTSGQTADIAFVTKPMRRIGSLHCILAYLFNTTVIALLINIAASML